MAEDGKIEEALSNVDAFLSREVGAQLRSDALGLRAELNNRLGNVDSAKRDLLLARSLTGPNYMRYVHELSLANPYESQNLNKEAHSWYRAAPECSLRA